MMRFVRLGWMRFFVKDEGPSKTTRGLPGSKYMLYTRPRLAPLTDGPPTYTVTGILRSEETGLT